MIPRFNWTKKDKRAAFGFTVIALVILLFLLSSCSNKAVKYTRKAAKHERKRNEFIQKAIAHGAKINVDTSWAIVPILSPEIKFETVLSPLSFKDTIIVRDPNTGQEIKVKVNVDTTSREPKGTISIKSKTPPQKSEQKVPIATSTKITACHGFWYDAKLCAIAAVLGFGAGAIFWASVRAWLRSLL